MTKHIEFAERETCIAISCDSSDGECIHLLEPSKALEFVKTLGFTVDTDLFDAVRAAVENGYFELVDHQVHTISEPDFVWYDFDSPFYGNRFKWINI